MYERTKAVSNIIQTERLILRLWKSEDAQPYYDINQDPEVIRYLRGPLTIEQVQYFIFSANAHYDTHGYTLWAVELKETGELIGFIGLNYIDWKTLFTPAVEIAWRLGTHFWGNGYATEGARAVLKYGFMVLGIQKIVSFTVPANTRSIWVMKKIGLQRDENGDFNHPKLSLDHPLSQHILYKLIRDDYIENILKS